MKAPKISIIIPVYNAEKYLRDCLVSIQNQTFTDFEVICVNDGSTDNSLKILEEFAKKDVRFKIINQKNQGVDLTRANGYKKAKGEYIAWVDNDDLCQPDMYRKLYESASQNASDIVICNYNLYPKKIARKEVWYKPFKGKNDWRFIARNTTLWNKIVKKTLLDRLQIDELFEDMGESAYSIVLASSDKISTIDEPLYNYRVGHGSVSGSFNKIGWFKTTVESTKKKYKYAKKHSLPEETREYFYYTYLYYVLVLMSVAARNNEKETYKSAKKIVKEARFFSKKYREFYRTNLSFPKRFFFRVFVYPNYIIAEITTGLALR